MGIAVMPNGPVPKLLVAVAIALGTLMSLCMFLGNAVFATVKFMSKCEDQYGQHRTPNLEQEYLAAEMEADEILYGVRSSSIPALPSVRDIDHQSLGLHVEVDEDGWAQTCAVCLSQIRSEEEVRRLPHCRHLFHTPCLDTWLQCNHRTCPLCRASLLPSLNCGISLALAQLQQEEEVESTVDILQFNNHIYARAP